MNPNLSSTAGRWLSILALMVLMSGCSNGTTAPIAAVNTPNTQTAQKPDAELVVTGDDASDETSAGTSMLDAGTATNVITPVDLTANYKDEAGNTGSVTVNKIWFTEGPAQEDQPADLLSHIQRAVGWEQVVSIEYTIDYKSGGVQEPDTSQLAVLLLYPDNLEQSLSTASGFDDALGVNNAYTNYFTFGKHSYTPDGKYVALAGPGGLGTPFWVFPENIGTKTIDIGRATTDASYTAPTDQTWGSESNGLFSHASDEANVQAVVDVMTAPIGALLISPSMADMVCQDRWGGTPGEYLADDSGRRLSTADYCLLAAVDFSQNRSKTESSQQDQAMNENGSSKNQESSTLPPAGNGCSWENEAVTSAIEVHSDHSKDSAVTNTVPAGTTIDYEKCSANGWVRVSYDGAIGWARNEKLP